MLALVVIVFIFTAISKAHWNHQFGPEVAKCMELFHPEKAYEECVMRKFNLLLDNNSLDERAASLMLDEHAMDKRHLSSIERIRDRCLDKGRFRNYAPAHICDSVKFFICGYLNNIMECPQWRNTEKCIKYQEFFGRCEAILDENLKELY